MPRTGDKCERSGLYEGVDEHACRDAFDRGAKLPPCPDCGNSIEWKMVASGPVG